MRKGQAEVIEYVFIILLSVFLISVITVVIYNVYAANLKTEIRSNLEQLVLTAADNILKLYDLGKNSKATAGQDSSVKISEINLGFPNQISGRSYEIILTEPNLVWQNVGNITIGGQEITPVTTTSGAKIIARTLQDPEITVERDLPNMDVSLQGKCENGENCTLSYYRFNYSATTTDKITLGKEEIFINIEGIS